MKRVISTGLLWLSVLAWAVASSQEGAGADGDEVIVGSAPGPEFSALTGDGTWELRIYTINRGRLDDFVSAWREGVYPLRLEQGFRIPAAWISRENNQFIWILGYDGPLSWDEAQSAYYGSSQRQSLDVDPLDLIAHGDTWPITAVR